MWAWAPRGFCVFSSPPSSFSVHSSGCFSRDSFSSSSVLLLPSLLLWFRQSSTVASHSSSSFPLLETVPESLGYPVPPCLSLSLFVSVSVLYERQRSFPFFPSSCFFLPTWFLSVCALHLPPSLSLCLSEPVGSQTERVSRGLKRGIISLLLPPLAPSHSLSITVFIPPHPSTSPSYHTNSFSLFRHTRFSPAFTFLPSIVFSRLCSDTYCTDGDIRGSVTPRLCKDTEATQGKCVTEREHDGSAPCVCLCVWDTHSNTPSVIMRENHAWPNI